MERFLAPLKCGAFVEKSPVFARESRRKENFLEWKRQRDGAVGCQRFDYFFNFQGREMKEGREGNDEEM